MYNSASFPTVTNCILWGDTASVGPEIFDSNSTPMVSYSDISGGYGGVSNINADPRFVNPGNVQLTSTSPAIDAGDNTAVTTSYDLYGTVRILDGPDVDTTATVDMGAYEYLP